MRNNEITMINANNSSLVSNIAISFWRLAFLSLGVSCSKTILQN
jgi:hypothetical protein